jgi:hypothetical protein
MHKIVVERERGGGTPRNRKWHKRLPFIDGEDYENEVKFASSGPRRQYGGQSKWLTDVLRPLEGFLHSNVGRPWDKVYSELRNGLDVRKVTGLHIFDHLGSMVKKNCEIGIDRRVYSYPWGNQVTGFYVHPTNGLLCFVPRKSKRQRQKERLERQEIHEVRIDRTHSYRLLDGQWYLVSHKWVENHGRSALLVWDVALRKHINIPHSTTRVAISKRQCNRNEVVEIQKQVADHKKKIRRM